MASYVSAGYLLHRMAALMGDELSNPARHGNTLAGNSIGLVAGGVVGTSAVVYRWTRNSDVRPGAAALCGALPFVFLNLILVLLSIVGIIQLFIVHQFTTLEAFAFRHDADRPDRFRRSAVVFGMSHPSWLSVRVTSPRSALGRLSQKAI